MRYDRDFGPRGSRPGNFAGGGEYGGAYEGPYQPHGFGRGFGSGAMRSRGSWYAGGRRPGNEYEPERGADFEWGGGYIGGRGYGGTNYDLEHGYATGRRSDSRAPRGGRLREGESEFSSPTTRGGYSWGEEEGIEEYGPARYGYGPYFERLRRRRRPDEEIRHDVEETLFFDTWVDADAISITVADGVVTLEGTLPSYEEVRFAVDDAWDVEGVRGVRSQLDVVEAQRRGPGRHDRAGESQLRGQGQERASAGWERHLHGHPQAGAGGEWEEPLQGQTTQPEAEARLDERAVGRASSRHSGRAPEEGDAAGTERARRRGRASEASVMGSGSSDTAKGATRGARSRKRGEAERGARGARPSGRGAKRPESGASGTPDETQDSAGQPGPTES